MRFNLSINIINMKHGQIPYLFMREVKNYSYASAATRRSQNQKAQTNPKPHKPTRSGSVAQKNRNLQLQQQIPSTPTSTPTLIPPSIEVPDSCAILIIDESKFCPENICAPALNKQQIEEIEEIGEFVEHCVRKIDGTDGVVYQKALKQLRNLYHRDIISLEGKVASIKKQIGELSAGPKTYHFQIQTLTSNSLQIQDQQHQTMLQTLLLINNQAVHRQVQKQAKKTIENLKNRIKYRQDKLISQSVQIQQRIQIFKFCVQNIRSKVQNLEDEVNVLIRLRDGICQLRGRIKEFGDLKIKLEGELGEGGRDKALRGLKTELQELEVSSQLMTNFYRSLDKKLQMLRNTITSQPSTTTSTSSSAQHNITTQLSTLTSQQASFLHKNTTYFQIYSQYIENEEEYKKLADVMSNLGEKFNDNLQHMKEEFFYVQSKLAECDRVVHGLTVLESERDRVVEEQRKILGEKNVELEKLTPKNIYLDSLNEFKKNAANRTSIAKTSPKK